MIKIKTAEYEWDCPCCKIDKEYEYYVMSDVNRVLSDFEFKEVLRKAELEIVQKSGAKHCYRAIARRQI